MGFAQYARVFLPAVVSLLIIASAAAAPPDVTSLFPAGGALGETPEVTITGTFNNWPVKFWCSNDRLKIDCGNSKGKLVIHIPADAPCGIAWIRLIDEEGASMPRPFIVAAQPSVKEKEPNDSFRTPQDVSQPAVVHGKYDKNGDADTYRVELAAGQTLVAALQSHEILGSPADGALQICNERNQVLAMNQDASGLDPLIIFRAETAGSYLVRTFALPVVPNSSINFAGGELHIYRLTLTTGPYVDHTLPLAVSRGVEASELKLRGWNLVDEKVAITPPEKRTSEPWIWSPSQAAGLIPLSLVDAPLVLVNSDATSMAGQGISLPCCITGVLEQRHAAHRYLFTGTKGAKLSIAIESAGLNYELDATLKLIGPDGKVVAEADDTAKNPDPSLNPTLPADGQYVLELRDTFHGSGPRHVYRLTIGPQQPRVTISIAAGNFVIEAGKTVDVPVTINRAGYSDEFTVTAIDLPPGVTVADAKSQNKGDTAKSVKLTFTANEDAQPGVLNIVAVDGSGNSLASGSFSQTLGGSTFQHFQPWLAVKKVAKKE
jgi:hypothetical protein